MEFEKALDFVINKRPCVFPNHAFIQQLKVYA